MLLNHAGVAFNDLRITFDDWAQYKPLTPAGQVPLWIEPAATVTEGKSSTTVEAKNLLALEDKSKIVPEGKTFNQSVAILRKLGRKLGYYSDDADACYWIDWAIETHGDLWAKKDYRVFLFKEEATDEELKTMDDNMRAFNGLIEKRLKDQGAKFLAGDKMTIGDILIFSAYINFCVNEKTMRPKHQEACAKSLGDHPLLTAWIEVMKGEFKDHIAKMKATVA